MTVFLYALALAGGVVFLGVLVWYFRGPWE